MGLSEGGSQGNAVGLSKVKSCECDRGGRRDPLARSVSPSLPPSVRHSPGQLPVCFFVVVCFFSATKT